MQLCYGARRLCRQILVRIYFVRLDSASAAHFESSSLKNTYGKNGISLAFLLAQYVLPPAFIASSSLLRFFLLSCAFLDGKPRPCFAFFSFLPFRNWVISSVLRFSSSGFIYAVALFLSRFPNEPLLFAFFFLQLWYLWQNTLFNPQCLFCELRVPLCVFLLSDFLRRQAFFSVCRFLSFFSFFLLFLNVNIVRTL